MGFLLVEVVLDVFGLVRLRCTIGDGESRVQNESNGFVVPFLLRMDSQNCFFFALGAIVKAMVESSGGLRVRGRVGPTVSIRQAYGTVASE